MKHLSANEAYSLGYRSITSDLWPERDTDKPIIASIALTLSTCDFVWIAYPWGAIQAARKRNELILSEDQAKRNQPK